MKIVSLLLQSFIFVLGVYVERFIRKRLYSNDGERRKKVKPTFRIITCTIVTLLIMFFNYKSECESQLVPFVDCYYISFDLLQILHVLVANTLLFSTHIVIKFSQEVDYSRYTIKGIFFAPLLQELIFRASFYRSAHTELPAFVMALLFSFSHFHRSIRKLLKGKSPRWGSSVGQSIFTLVFGVYSFWFLEQFQSVIPSIVLHCYCNFLGPPSIGKDNIKWHLMSIASFFAYCWLIV